LCRKESQSAGAVLKFAVKAKHLAASPADGAAPVFTSARGGGYLTPGQARYTFSKAVAAGGCTTSGTPAHRWRSAPGPT
jgi:hypothetical protein